jgi:3-oxoadipate enol-lactonase
VIDRWAERDGVRIAFTVEGADGAPPVLLCHSLGTTRDLWTPQLPELARTCRVIRYDARGHGRSSAPAGDYTVADLGLDALAVLDATDTPQACMAGVSMGGLVAQWLGAHAAPRVRGLVLANTAARFGNAAAWNDRIATVQSAGMASVADAGVAGWFSAPFREREPAIVDRYRRMVAACPPAGYIGCCAALRDADLGGSLSGISAPTLVIAGSLDQRTTVADAEYLREHMPDAALIVLEAAHLSNVEQAAAFTHHLQQFLSSRADHLHA